MPLHEPGKKKKQTTSLRSRIENVTHYDPENVSSDSESDENFAYSKTPVSSATYGRSRPAHTIRSRYQLHYQTTKKDIDSQPKKSKIYSPMVELSTPKKEKRNNQQVHIPHLHNIDRSRVEPGVLRKNDMEILSIIAEMADEKVGNTATLKGFPVSEDYQFTYLYGAFEAFTNLNHLSPDTYPAYYTLFNALVNLTIFKNGPYSESSYQLPKQLNTWVECVTAFQDSYNTASLKRSKYIMLRERLRSFDDATRERFLALWYDAYITSNQETTRLNQIADTFANATCMATARYIFRKWVLKTRRLNSIKRKAAHIDAILTKSKKFTLWQEITYKNDKLKEVADTVFAEKYFKKWMASFLNIKRMENRANFICSENIKNRVLHNWYQKNIESIVVDKFNKKLCLDILMVWIDKTAKIIKAQNFADEWDESNKIVSALTLWASKYELIQLQKETAVKVYDESLVKKTLVNWNKTLNDTLKTTTFQIEWNKRLVHRIFVEWNVRNLQRREARRFRDFMCAYRAFKSWRLGTQCKQIMRLHNVVLAKQVFKKWQLAEREQQLSKTIAQNYISGFIFHMKNKAAAQKKDREGKLKYFTKKRNFESVKRVLNIWRRKAGQSKANSRIADAIYIKSTHGSVARFFFTWSVKFHRLLNREEQASEFYETKLILKTIQKWENSVMSHHRIKQDNALELFLAKKNDRLKHRTLEAFFSRFDEILALEQKASIVQNSKTNQLCKKVLLQWVNKRRAIKNSESLADSILYDNQLHDTFALWKSRLQYVYLLEQHAQSFAQEQEYLLLDNALSVWRIGLFKLQTRYNAAKEFFERGDRRRASIALSIWRENTEKRMLMLQEEAFTDRLKQMPYNDGGLDSLGSNKKPNLNSLTDARSQTLFRGTSHVRRFTNTDTDSLNMNNPAAALVGHFAPSRPVSIDFYETGFFSTPRSVFGRPVIEDMSPLKARQQRSKSIGRYQDYRTTPSRSRR